MGRMRPSDCRHRTTTMDPYKSLEFVASAHPCFRLYISQPVGDRRDLSTAVFFYVLLTNISDIHLLAISV